MRTLTIAIVILAAIAGCKDKSPSAPAQAQSPASGATSTAPSGVTEQPVPMDQQPTAGGTENLEQMFKQLEVEKANRPGLAPTVETVLAALDTAGIKFDESKQVLGLTVGAKYCMRAGVNANGLNVVVCEHGTAKEAEDGVELIKTKFAQLAKTSTFTIRGTTTIQVMGRPNDPMTDVRRTIDEALAKL